jgi:hypothetical protein
MMEIETAITYTQKAFEEVKRASQTRSDLEDIRAELYLVLLDMIGLRAGMRPSQPLTVEGAMLRIKKQNIDRLARAKRAQLDEAALDEGALAMLKGLDENE